MRTITSPQRLCEHGNDWRGRNPIMELIANRLEELLGPIHDLSDEVLEKLYVHDRYDGGIREGRITGLEPGKYEPNKVVHWSVPENKYLPDEEEASTLASLRQTVRDE